MMMMIVEASQADECVTARLAANQQFGELAKCNIVHVAVTCAQDLSV
jgi:hypothetical protein